MFGNPNTLPWYSSRVTGLRKGLGGNRVGAQARHPTSSAANSPLSLEGSSSQTVIDTRSDPQMKCGMSETSRNDARATSTRLLGVLAVGLIAFSLLAMHALSVGHGMPARAERVSRNVATVTDRPDTLGIGHGAVFANTPPSSASEMCVAVLAVAISFAALVFLVGGHERQVGPRSFPTLTRAAVGWRADPPPPRSALSLRC